MGVVLYTIGQPLPDPSINVQAAEAVTQQAIGTDSLRILHVVTLVDDRSSYGGPLTVAVNQCNELRRRGHDARILAGWAGKGRAPTSIEGVPAHLFRVRSFVPGTRFSGLLSMKMLNWLRCNAKTFDVAHLHTARDLVPLSAGQLLRFSRVRYTTQTHGMVLPDGRRSAKIIDRLLTLRVLRNAVARFVLTDVETAALADLLGAHSLTIQLPNGITVQESPRTPTQPPDVLFMARLHPRKHVLDFALAALTLIKEGHDVRFSVVGPDEGDLPALQGFIGLNPLLDGRLHYEGPMAHGDAMPRLRRASMFVLPSVDEPFPMTLLEALAVGTPAICTTSCGVAKDLQASNAAMVIAPGAEPLVVALRLLIEDPALQLSLSLAGQQAARAGYSMHAVGNRLLAAYTQTARVAR